MFSILVLCVVDVPWDPNSHSQGVPYTMIAFMVGAFTSMLAGYIGMKIATACNYKTTYLCNIDIDEGFKIAYRGG